LASRSGWLVAAGLCGSDQERREVDTGKPGRKRERRLAEAEAAGPRGRRRSSATASAAAATTHFVCRRQAATTAEHGKTVSPDPISTMNIALIIQKRDRHNPKSRKGDPSEAVGLVG